MNIKICWFKCSTILYKHKTYNICAQIPSNAELEACSEITDTAISCSEGHEISHFQLQLVGYTCMNENISEREKDEVSRHRLTKATHSIVVPHALGECRRLLFFFEIIRRRIYCRCRARLKCWKFLFIHSMHLSRFLSADVKINWTESNRRIHRSLMQFDFASMDALMWGGMKWRREEIDEMMTIIIIVVVKWDSRRRWQKRANEKRMSNKETWTLMTIRMTFSLGKKFPYCLCCGLAAYDVRFDIILISPSRIGLSSLSFDCRFHLQI